MPLRTFMRLRLRDSARLRVERCRPGHATVVSKAVERTKASFIGGETEAMGPEAQETRVITRCTGSGGTK